MRLWLRKSFWVALGVLTSLGTVVPCSAQSFEAVGVRALGMAGAFVGVANDASAGYWNPAGLARGDFFSALVERTNGDVRLIGETLPEVPAMQASGTLVAVGVPSIGMSYYRLTSATRRLRPDAAVLAPTVLESLVTSQFGVTLLQSLSDNLVVASTFKVVHGVVKRGTADFEVPAEEALDSLDDLDGQGSTKFDLDLGVMLSVGVARIGVTARNMREAEFETPEDDRLTLERQVRVGFAVLPTRGTTIAVDLDLQRTPSAIGDQRHLAVGAEQWLAQRRLGVRGGLRMNTIDELRPSASGGLSLGLTRTFFVDLQVTRGGDDADRAWSVGGRIGY